MASSRPNRAGPLSMPRFDFYGMDTDMENSRYSALKQACKSGTLSSVRSMLQSTNQAGLDLHQSEPLVQRHLQKCLFEAFVNNNFDTARYLIRDAGAEMKPIEVPLVMHAVTKFMPVQAFEFLIQEGWDINSPLREYRTALSYVLRSLPLTKWLLEHGANPNLGPDTCQRNTREASLVPNSGFILGSAACTNPSTATALIDLLIQYGARLEDSIPLHRVAGCLPHQNSVGSIASGDTTYQQALLDSEVIATSPFSSRIPVLQHLLELGYDLDASDVAHWNPRSLGTPLHWAVHASAMENARFLLEKGADPMIKSTYGLTALEAAAQQNRIHNPSGKDRLAQKYLQEALLENELPGRIGNPFARVLEKLETEEIEDEPLQESELEKLIKRFM